MKYCYSTAFDLNTNSCYKSPSFRKTMGRHRGGAWRNFSEISQNEVTRAKGDIVANPERMYKLIDECATSHPPMPSSQ